MIETSADETVLRPNPQSGGADHAAMVRDRTTLREYRVGETQWEHHAIQLAQQAAQGTEQANLEDGLLDVTISEDATSADLATDRFEERLFDNEGKNLERILAFSIELHIDSGETIAFSLDGEIVELGSIEISTLHGPLEMYVGESYQPSPRVGRTV